MGHRGLMVMALDCGAKVQVPPADSFSLQIFKTEEKEAEKQNALANLTTRRERELG